MTTLKHKHRSALNHAVHLLRSAISRCPDGAVKDGIREDVRLLKQIDESIRDELVSPSLPFEVQEKPSESHIPLEAEYHGPADARTAS